MKHPYHIVDPSPWPLVGAAGVLFLVSGLVSRLNGYKTCLMMLGWVVILLTMYQWWRDVSREATFQGKHTSKVEFGLRLGMLMFILSEVFFFISFFWAFFHSSLSPSTDLGVKWPPSGIQGINPYEVPLLNTVLLLSSGASITWVHYSILNSMYNEANMGFILTVGLGILFSLLQSFEYHNCSFSMSDSVYGSSFYLATGFHGLHVLIGTLFIAVMWFRHSKSLMTQERHFGFEASAWYWHFVDVVWLMLYLCIYWWGF